MAAPAGQGQIANRLDDRHRNRQPAIILGGSTQGANPWLDKSEASISLATVRPVQD
jgi:hypothetical protein